jgi:DnaK suppressor protein
LKEVDVTAARKATAPTPKKAAPAKKAAAAPKASVSSTKKPVATKAAPAPKKAATVKKPSATKPAATKPTAGKAAPTRTAPAKATPAKATSSATKKAPPAKPTSSTKAAPAKKPAPATKAAPAKSATATKKADTASVPAAPRRPTVGPYAKEPKFLEEQRALLLEERGIYDGQAHDLRAEADSLALEREPGDVQFDEESGEGGTVTVDRERNLALSAQASAAVEEIDDAVRKIERKTYGACERCHQPIPKARLRALPFARLCVACKSGGLSRR